MKSKDSSKRSKYILTFLEYLTKSIKEDILFQIISRTGPGFYYRTIYKLYLISLLQYLILDFNDNFLLYQIKV